MSAPSPVSPADLLAVLDYFGFAEHLHRATGEQRATDWPYVLGLFQVALLWYYCQRSQQQRAISDDSARAWLFDSETTCQYISGVFFDAKQPISGETIAAFARELLPQYCRYPYFSLQFVADIDPATDLALLPEIARGVQLVSQLPQVEVELLRVMYHDLMNLPALRDDLEFVEIVSPGEIPTAERHSALFEVYERICADAFEYTYSALITDTHPPMGDTFSRPVKYSRNIVRRVSDGYIVGLAAYLLSDGLPTGYISELCVRPECQKQGFGIYTINAVMHAMKNRGCRVAVLTSTAAGRALYLKTGWQMDPSQVYFKITHAPDHH